MPWRSDRSNRQLHATFHAHSVITTIVTVCLIGAEGVSAATAVADKANQALMECAQLEQEDFTRVADAPATVLSAEVVPAESDRSEYCSVKGYIQPQIQFEIRLPTKAWNGRYFQTGCGGFCGVVNISACDDALARGFVVAANNMGHVSSIQDGLWGSDPKLRYDFGPRSTHVMAVLAKAIIERFYGESTAYSYFRGCSTGGREGLLAALHWPEDFHGVIAGDPAFPARQGGIINNWFAHSLHTDDGKLVFSDEKLAVLNSTVLEKCDAIDDLKDGIIDDPRNCNFDATSMACPRGKESANCLTAQQVDAAQRLYDGPRHSRTKQRLFPGYVAYGSEKFWNAAGNANYANQFLRFLAFAETPPLSYRYSDFNFDSDIVELEEYAAIYDPVAPYTDPDTSKFHKAGGKLIVYHGWADPSVPPTTTLDFYAEVAQRSGGIEKVQKWYRVFMVPGMGHCRGGGVPDTFDMLSAIVAWTEKELAPDRIVATQFDGDKVIRTRPLYPYPTVARYSGSGDVNDAANWKPVSPTTKRDDDIKWMWDPD
jgi:feruloyl esterase